MANYFSIENPKTVTNTTQNYGFVVHNLNPVNINDNLIVHGDDLNKMGASIPTPFARMFLFNLAFEQVNKEEEDKPGEGQIGIIDENDPNQQRIPSGYHYLVSECLDMFEFIYKYGDNKDFGVHEWSFASECKALEQSNAKGHEELARALSAPHELHSPIQVIRDIDEVYIFTWKGKIIGGTSPKTIVYTSPNLKEAINGEHFVGDQGNELFNNNVYTPLYKRTEAFRRFMYLYLMIDMNGVNSIHAIKKYIENSRDNYDKSLYQKMEKEGLVKNPKYSQVKRLSEKNIGDIISGNIWIYVADNTPVLGDYLIEPTTQNEMWDKEYVNGAFVEVRKPMVLTRNGNKDFSYINGRQWIKGKDLIDNPLPKHITERILPSTTYKYPYLTVDDFLESRIIEVSYNIRKESFGTGSMSNVQHILPLKKEFFRYFRKEDLFDNEGNPTDMIQVAVDPEDDRVTVKLNIPVKGGELTLIKEYDNSVKVNCYDAANTFDLAFFPFYRMVSDAGIDNNVYNIMLGSTVKDGLTTKFYKVEDLRKKPDEQALGNLVKESIRTSGEINTTHIHVEGAFDLMELCIGTGEKSATGLLVPLFKQVFIANAKKQYHYCIDFGTTNTHVVYAEQKIGGNAIVDLEDVHSFDIKDSERQVITLNDDDGVAEFVKFTTFMRREFAPLRIGERERVKFPFRTTTCQVERKVNTLRMFDNTNIGFNYNEELATDNLTTCRYETNIKWNRNDPLSRSRLEEFFAEMLWIMKNKALLNGGTEDFTVVATYPQSMSIKETDALMEAWENAKQRVKSDVELDFKYESIAPYYSYLYGLFGDAYANFDIGGGTTDILHVNPDTDEAVSLSAIFAANDIWGDGVNNPKNNNAFVKYYLSSKEYGKLSDSDKETIRSVIKNSNSSADIISYLFLNDDKTNLTQAIESNVELMQIVITHFASLVYYLAYVIDLQMLRVPQKITFTGMGSKYIKMISSNEKAIAKIIQAIFAYYAELSGNEDMQKVSLTVEFAKNPKEVTARGGLVMKGHKHPIVPETNIFYGYDGEEPGKILRYSDLEDKAKNVETIFGQFLKLFKDTDFNDTLDDLGFVVSEDFCTMIEKFASRSYQQQMKSGNDMNKGVQSPRLKEPIFFWPLKNALYMAGQQIVAQNAKKE